MTTVDILDELRSYDPDVDEKYVIDRAIAEIVRLRAAVGDLGEWKRTRWWRAIAPDGSLWCESSSEDEVRGAARAWDRIETLWKRTEWEWRAEPDA